MERTESWTQGGPLRQHIAINPQRMRSQHASWSSTGTGSPPCCALCRCFCVFTSHLSTPRVKEHETGPDFTLYASSGNGPAVPLGSSLQTLTAGVIRNRQLRLTKNFLPRSGPQAELVPAASSVNLEPKEAENKRPPCLPSLGEQFCLSAWGAILRQAGREVNVSAFPTLPHKKHTSPLSRELPFS